MPPSPPVASRTTSFLSLPASLFRRLVLLCCALLFLSIASLAQCPFSATLSATTTCLGSSVLNISSANTPAQITWYKDGNSFETLSGTPPEIVAKGNLSYIFGVTVYASGNVYASDLANFRVLKFPAGSNAGTSGVTVAGGNGPGTAANQLTGPQGLFIDAAGDLYVCDEPNSRVLEFPPGSTSTTLGVVVAGGNGAGSNPNQFNYPHSVWVDGSGNIFIADLSNFRVQKWAPGAAAGTTVAGGNGAGSALNQFGSVNGPTGVTVDAGGNLYVADFSNNRILKFPPGSTGATLGVVVAGGNGAGSNPNQFSYCQDVYVDGSGDLFISDVGNQRIQEWLPGATQGITVAGAAVSAVPSISEIIGLTLDAAGNIYVADQSGEQVTEWPHFPPSLSTTYTPTAVGTYYATITNTNACSVSTNQIIVAAPVTPSISISTSSTILCPSDIIQLSANIQNGGDNPGYQWMDNGTPLANVGGSNPSVPVSTLANGDIITCQLTSNNTCVTSSTALSNAITLTVKSAVSPSVNIVATPSASCPEQPVTFTVQLTNGGTTPAYQWKVDGVAVGSDTPAYTSSTLSNGDMIACFVTNDQDCSPAGSDSIIAVVNPDPVITAGQAYSIVYGGSVQLDPGITGNIVQYTWTPSTGLSDSAIRDPVASPTATIEYTLTVVDDNGCTASGQVSVRILSALAIPNAFTPNGDGKNDIFYVLGGPPGSIVKDLSIYNRWGQRIFLATDATPGDPRGGWDGRINGTYAMPGTYIYLIDIRLANGKLETYRGALELIR